MADLTRLTPGTWTIDPAHSTVTFVARHLMLSKVRGRFAEFSGVLTVGEQPINSSVVASIDLASVTTGDEGRDAHLRSADFFDVERFPTMVFDSTAVKESGAGAFVLIGDLTIKGVTRQAELDLEFEGVRTDPWGNTKAGFTANGEVNRKDWGLEWNVALDTGGVLVSEKVKLELDIQARKD